ncbi:MAG: cutinase family protein [Candidatus Saccharibacteria bacterium]|nr:cutinase family protein [Candidatus Saccharibacteria bacterium]
MREKNHLKIHYLLVAGLVSIAILFPIHQVSADSCPSLRLVFARGSGGERWTDQNYLAFKSSIESKLGTTNLDYEFIDLDYPAVGVGLDKLDTTIGALFGAGNAYEFGESINTGVENLKNMIDDIHCPNTKYILGGYSQGAMVISKSLHQIKSDRIIYAATFGDPKIYLPEGAGLFPAACRGENLSDYRMYVPDCYAYTGLLGAYQPYEPDNFKGKVGTWCNNRDIFCSSKHYNLGDILDHTSYVKDELYTDAAKVIFDKITKTFGLENRISSPHDTAFLIDSSSSMADLFEQYRNEAMRLATETIESGGRIALFDYRDLSDPYELKQHCGFEDCTLTKFWRELNAIELGGGGDIPESLLSASFHTMQTLNWRQGSTKSVVVLTDADFLSPDLDGTTMDDVIKLSKRIDPVNFYIITEPEFAAAYTKFASATDGKVETNFDALNLLTDHIMERYDSLPRVEEIPAPKELPKIEVTAAVQNGPASAIVEFANTGNQAIIVLNDQILGLTNDIKVTVADLDYTKTNTLTLIPLDSDSRGNPATVDLSSAVFIPGAPNTGKL